MIFIWAIFETIGYFRKKTFSQRVSSGAKWSTAFCVLAVYGQLPSNQTHLIYLFMAIFTIASISLPVYFLRTKAFYFVSRKILVDSNKKMIFENYKRKIYFYALCISTQLLSIVAGYYFGVLILVLSKIFIFDNL